MIYLDNSATTAMRRELLSVIEEYSVNNPYNPSGLYTRALNITKDITVARKTILDILGGNNYDLTFTSGGSESNNTAIYGARIPKNSRIIISSMEHSAIYNPVMALQNKGYDIVQTKCDKYGKVDYDDFVSLLTPNVGLVSIMHVCNETGAINDIQSLVKATKAVNPKAIFHSDGVQAVGKIPVKLSMLGVDMYSFSAHKFHGMKGVGGLIIKKGINIAPLILGGGQEKGLRSSTENVSGIITTATAMARTYEDKNAIIPNLRNRIINGITDVEPRIRLNTNIEESAPYIISISLPNCRGEVILHGLEDRGIIIGTGSACSSHSGNNRIAKALELSPEYSMGMIRISLNNYNTDEEVTEFLDKFKIVYTEYRNFVK